MRIGGKAGRGGIGGGGGHRDGQDLGWGFQFMWLRCGAPLLFKTLRGSDPGASHSAVIMLSQNFAVFKRLSDTETCSKVRRVLEGEGTCSVTIHGIAHMVKIPSLSRGCGTVEFIDSPSRGLRLRQSVPGVLGRMVGLYDVAPLNSSENQDPGTLF